MKRRRFIQLVGSTPVVLGVSGVAFQSCMRQSLDGDLLADGDTVVVPKQYRIFQFYAPFTSGDLSKMGVSTEIFYKKHVRLDYEKIKTITNRVSAQEVDGAKHKSFLDVQALVNQQSGELEIDPYLNHSNPNSHIIFFNKQDLVDLIGGKNIYLATGFHEGNHFHMVMVRPDFAQNGTFLVERSKLEGLDGSGGLPASNGDDDKDGVLNGEDACPGSTPGKTVWNKANFKEGTSEFETAKKFNGCHAGQVPK